MNARTLAATGGERARKRDMALVMLYARGNVSLAQGRYTTAEDIRKKRERLKKYRFK